MVRFCKHDNNLGVPLNLENFSIAEELLVSLEGLFFIKLIYMYSIEAM